MDLRKCPPVILAAVLAFAGCGKSPEEVKAEKTAEVAKTTGSLVVKRFASSVVGTAGNPGASDQDVEMLAHERAPVSMLI